MKAHRAWVVANIVGFLLSFYLTTLVRVGDGITLSGEVPFYLCLPWRECGGASPFWAWAAPVAEWVFAAIFGGF